MKFNVKHLFLSLLLIISCFFGIGYASFLVGGGYSASKEGISVIDSGKAVCYNGSTKAKYTSIEAAIEDTTQNSGVTIYCIPGTNPTIKRGFTIPTGVTLCLPYEDNLSNTHNYFSESGNNDSNNEGYGDNNSSYNKNTVTINNNVSITVNGTVIVGGMTGSTRVQGGSVSSHCSIQMGTNTYLYFNENSKLECYGFIKESVENTAHIRFNQKSTLITPISFYDYSSASTMLEYKDNGVFPFKQFDVASIRPEMEFKYGCLVTGKVHTYGNTAGDINSNAQLIGTSESFLNMVEGSTIKWKFSDSSSLSKTSNSMTTHSTNISISGNISLGFLQVVIKRLFATYTINSSDFYLPIPYGFNISLEDGSYFKLPNNIKGVKFMPGSSVTAQSNSTIEANCGVLFYQSNISYDGAVKFAYVSSAPARFITSGRAIINSGFEGVIEVGEGAQEKTAIIEFSPSCGPITDSRELNQTNYYSWGGAKGKILRNDFDSEDIDNNNYILSNNDAFSNSTTYYNVFSNSLSCNGWYDGKLGTYGILYSNQILGTFDSDGSDVILAPLENSNENLRFGGFYYDSKFTLPLEESGSNYVLKPNDAIKYVGNKTYVELFVNWIDITAGSYQVNITQKEIKDHKSFVSISSSTSLSLGTNYELPSDGLHDYYYENLTSSGTKGSGKYNYVNFNGYEVNVTDENGNIIYSNLTTDSNGNSTNGLINSWTIDSSSFADGYVVDITATYSVETSEFSFELITSNTTVGVKSSIDIQINGIDILTNKGIVLSYFWSCDNAKGAISDSTANSTTLTNNYSGGWITNSISAKLSCVIFDSTSSSPGFELFTLEETITLKKGRNEK